MPSASSPTIRRRSKRSKLAGVRVVERISAQVPSEPSNERYLQTKREKMGHLVI